MLNNRNYWEIIQSLLFNLKALGIHIEISEFLVCDHLSSLPNISSAGLLTRQIQDCDIENILKIDDKPAEAFRKRIHMYQDEGILINYRGKTVGYAWISQTKMRIPSIGYERQLKENEIYLYDGIIDEKHRGIGLFPLFLVNLIRDSINMGKIIVNSINITNYESIKLHKKLGFRKTDISVFVRVGRVWNYHYIFSVGG